MSTGQDRKSIDQELDRVRESIEKCMLMYMNKRKTLSFLSSQSNIHPAVTRLVWARLERDNPEFFRAYYVRLAVQEQIIEFNRLLPAQAELMRRMGLTGNTNMFNSSLPQATQQTCTPNVVHEGSRHNQAGNMQQEILSNSGISNQAWMERSVDQSRETTVYPNSVLYQQHLYSGLQHIANEPIFSGSRSDLPSNLVGSNPPRHLNSNNNARNSDDFRLNYYGLSEQQHPLISATECLVDYPSALNLSINLQHMDHLVVKHGVWEQYYQPTPEYSVDSFSSTGTGEPGSSASLRKPFSG